MTDFNAEIPFTNPTLMEGWPVFSAELVIFLVSSVPSAIVSCIYGSGS